MITYRQILRMSALKVNAVKGVQASALETNYAVSPLTTTQVQSVDFPLKFIQDSLVSVIGKIIRAYANTSDHPFRNFHETITASITNGARIPSVSSTSKPIVGAYGAIRDASTGNVLTEQPKQLIENIRSNADSHILGTYYHYKIVGNRLYHTVTNAVIDVVTFSITDEETAIAANGNTPLPDACLDIAVDGLCSVLDRDEAYTNQAALCRQAFEKGLMEFERGSSLYQPAPTLINTKESVVS